MQNQQQFPLQQMPQIPPEILMQMNQQFPYGQNQLLNMPQMQHPIDPIMMQQFQMMHQQVKFYPVMDWEQTWVQPPPTGPYPGITQEEYNKFNVQDQQGFLRFLKEVGEYYKTWLPRYQKTMSEFLKKELTYIMTKEEHELMDEYLNQEQWAIQMKQDIEQQQQIQKQQQQPQQPLPQTSEEPQKKVRKPLNLKAKQFEPIKIEAPKMPKYPTPPNFLDFKKFQENYQLFLDFYKPDDITNFDFTKFPSPEDEKKLREQKQKKEKEKQQKQIECQYKRKTQPKEQKTEPKEQKVVIEDLEIDTSVFIEPDEVRQPINIVFIGHVDAGKSTLCGRILVDVGEINEADIKKFEQEAKENNREGWWLAYCLDINEEERKKGKTVECGKAYFITENKRFTIFDAPGHKNYVPNMIMGACQADVAGLIISAKMGEFESGFDKGGQTQEHAFLAKSLGVEHLIIIITKMDTIDWDEKRFKMIADSITEFINKQCSFKTVTVIPIDALNDANIVKLSDKCPWYAGPPLIKLLNDLPVAKPNPDGPIRIPVLDKLKDQGQFIFGKIESGTIVDGLQVSLYPRKQPFQVQGIYNSKDQRMKYAKAGENVKIKVRNIEEDDITRGNVVCNLESNPVSTCVEFQAKVQLLDLPEHKRIFSQGYTCVLHLHCLVEEIEISFVEAVFDPETKKPIKQTFLRSNQEGIVKISSKNVLCLEKFDSIISLGRFALRDEGKSIGFGEVLKIKPLAKKENIQQQVVQQLLQAPEEEKKNQSNEKN